MTGHEKQQHWQMSYTRKRKRRRKGGRRRGLWYYHRSLLLCLRFRGILLFGLLL